jgi:TIR domain
MSTTELNEMQTAADWLAFAQSKGWKEGASPVLMVSYTGHDKRWVDEVHKYIGDGVRDIKDAATAERFKIWDYANSESGTKLGEHFPTEIALQMWTCQCAIVIYSQEYLGSVWCREIELPFLLWRRKHHGIDLFIIRVGETTRDGKPWVFPGDGTREDSIKLEELIDDRNPALSSGSKDFSGDFIDSLDRPRLNRRLTALANGIERQISARQDTRRRVLVEIRRKAEADAEAAKLRLEAERLKIAAVEKAAAQAENMRQESDQAKRKANADSEIVKLRLEADRIRQEAEDKAKAEADSKRRVAEEAKRNTEAEVQNQHFKSEQITKAAYQRSSAEVNFAPQQGSVAQIEQCVEIKNLSKQFDEKKKHDLINDAPKKRSNEKLVSIFAGCVGFLIICVVLLFYSDVVFKKDEGPINALGLSNNPGALLTWTCPDGTWHIRTTSPSPNCRVTDGSVRGFTQNTPIAPVSQSRPPQSGELQNWVCGGTKHISVMAPESTCKKF